MGRQVDKANRASLATTVAQSAENVAASQQVAPAAAATNAMQSSFGNGVVNQSLDGQGGQLGTAVASEIAGGAAGLSAFPNTLQSNRAMLHAMRQSTPGATGLALRKGGGAANESCIQDLIASSSGSVIPEAVASRFGAVLGTNLSDVALHTDGAAQKAAKAMGAHAFAIGNDVYFGAGEYSPGSASGDELLAHELHHVVQHKEGRLPSGGSGLNVSKPSDSVEREARAVASQAMATLADPILEAILAAAPNLGLGAAGEDRGSSSTSSASANMAMRDTETGTDQAAGDEEEDDSWLIAGIKQWWPDLGEVLDKGLVEAFSDDLMEAADLWLEEHFADINVETFANDIAEKIGGAAGGLVGASLGDQACCEAFEAWIGQFTAMAEHFVGAGSPIAMLSDVMTGGVKSAMEAFGRLIDGSGVVEAVGGAITDVGLWIDGMIAEVADWNQTAGDWLVEHFGATENENGFVGIITDAATELFAKMGESIQGAIDTVLEAIFSVGWISDLHAMVDFALEMRDGVAWLQANWGDPNIWERVEELKTELPVFADLLLKGKGVWDQLSGQATEGAMGWVESIDAALEGLGLPTTSAVYTFIKGIVEGVQWIIDSPVWAEISEALSVAWEFGSNLVIDLIDIGVSLAACVGAPLLIFPFIMGSALLMLPDCYKAPIFDFLISIMLATSAIWMLPMLVVMPLAAPMMQIMLEGALQGMKTLDVDQKEAMLTRFAELLQLQFLGEFARGLIVGVVEGVVYEIIGILQLLKMLADLANPFTWIGWMWDAFVFCLTTVGSAVGDAAMGAAETFDQAGDRGKGEDAYAEQPDVDIDQAPQAPTPEVAPETPDGPSLMDPSSWPSVESLLGGLVDGALQFLTDKVAEAAQGVAEALLSASEAPYTLGYGVGYIAGWALVQFGIFVLTAGFGEAVNLVKSGVQALWVALRGSWRAMVAGVRAAITSIGTVLDDLARMISSISIPGLGKIGTWLKGAWAKLVKWFDDFVNWVKGSPKTKPKGKPKPKKKPKKGGDDEEDDDPNLKTEAQKEADEGWKLIKGDKELDAQDAEEKEIESAEDKRETKSKEHTLDFTLHADKSKKTYQVQAVAKSGTKKGTAKSKKKGWAADELEGTKMFFAPVSAETKNQEAVTAAEADFQTKWDARTSEDPKTHMDQAGTAAVSGFEGSKMYKPMKMEVKFTNPKPDEGTIQYQVTVSPNALDTGVKTLNAGTGKLADRIKQIEDNKHPTLLVRFETKAWQTAFNQGSSTARADVAEAKKIERLYEVSSRVYLFVPIPDGEVPALIAERANAAGRESSHLVPGPFGTAQLVSFITADSDVGSLQANWSGGAQAALDLLVSQGHIVAVDGGYSFDQGYPLPTPGLHTVKETRTVPDKKRESHHAPAKGLANAWHTELKAIVDSLGDEGSEFWDQIGAYKSTIETRAGKFESAHKNTNSTMLTAILIHEDTHQGLPDSVHTANSKDTTEEIIDRMESKGLVIYTSGDEVMASNPQMEHWRDYIAKCYTQVATEDGVREGVDPLVAQRKIDEMNKAFGEGDAAVKQAVEKSLQSLSAALEESIDAAYDMDQAKIRQALAKSSKDGDTTQHGTVMTELKRVHEEDSIWLSELGADLSG